MSKPSSNLLTAGDLFRERQALGGDWPCSERYARKVVASLASDFPSKVKTKRTHFGKLQKFVPRALLIKRRHLPDVVDIGDMTLGQLAALVHGSMRECAEVKSDARALREAVGSLLDAIVELRAGKPSKVDAALEAAREALEGTR